MLQMILGPLLPWPGHAKNNAHGLRERCWPPLVIHAVPTWPISSKLKLSLFSCKNCTIVFLGLWYCSYGGVLQSNRYHDSSKDVRTLDVSEAALGKAAGNGMHLPSAGFVALVAMICLTDLWLFQPPMENMLEKSVWFCGIPIILWTLSELSLCFQTKFMHMAMVSVWSKQVKYHTCFGWHALCTQVARCDNATWCAMETLRPSPSDKMPPNCCPSETQHATVKSKMTCCSVKTTRMKAWTIECFQV